MPTQRAGPVSDQSRNDSQSENPIGYRLKIANSAKNGATQSSGQPARRSRRLNGMRPAARSGRTAGLSCSTAFSGSP